MGAEPRAGSQSQAPWIIAGWQISKQACEAGLGAAANPVERLLHDSPGRHGVGVEVLLQALRGGLIVVVAGEEVGDDFTGTSDFPQARH